MDGSDDEGPYTDGSQEEFSDTDNPDAMPSRTVHNQPHDEEVTLTDNESESPGAEGSMPDLGGADEEGGGRFGDMGAAPRAGVESPPRNDMSDEEDTMMMNRNARESHSLGDAPVEGQYNPADFASLNVSDDVRQIFKYIEKYQPRPHKLESKLQCFIPEYIPAIGDIDEFIKVPRPDGQPDFLGLRVLDEPATVQTDPTVLNLQLRQVSKQGGARPLEITSVEQAAKNPKRIETWIKSIQELHAGKPLPTMTYSKNMPELEALMQEWPQEMEEAINQVRLPSGNLDVDILTLTKVFCNLLDIPVYEGKAVESLHVLFSLYVELKNNPYLKAQNTQLGNTGRSDMGSVMGAMMGTMTSDAGVPMEYLQGGFNTVSSVITPQ
uniref:Intraflagellar transport protein 46-like n=1 Tax=Tetraselmis sp. GSL018 TaxID=582737 RepID=A0A061RRN6_9CHLO|eukprot:CAMPEP_0177623316 /NCGR_PEP_ID=MMETSP0419_2-20121207/28839_1 /TAXON_ID=582737 /ORGANISM="Tetraselmis sp., Strain GSL018" /LENGTH=380 /DNA_ID=CAMNT_0019123863 /DNA_START=207 /DNA_END=1349 /DNA_ORIENTATION=-